MSLTAQLDAIGADGRVAQIVSLATEYESLKKFVVAWSQTISFRWLTYWYLPRAIHADSFDETPIVSYKRMSSDATERRKRRLFSDFDTVGRWGIQTNAMLAEIGWSDQKKKFTGVFFGQPRVLYNVICYIANDLKAAVVLSGPPTYLGRVAAEDGRTFDDKPLGQALGVLQKAQDLLKEARVLAEATVDEDMQMRDDMDNTLVEVGKVEESIAEQCEVLMLLSQSTSKGERPAILIATFEAAETAVDELYSLMDGAFPYKTASHTALMHAVTGVRYAIQEELATLSLLATQSASLLGAQRIPSYPFSDSTNAPREYAIISVAVDAINTVDLEARSARKVLNKLAGKMEKGDDMATRMLEACQRLTDIENDNESRLESIHESQDPSSRGAQQAESESNTGSAYPIDVAHKVYAVCSDELRNVNYDVQAVSHILFDIDLDCPDYLDVDHRPDEPHNTVTNFDKLLFKIEKALTEIATIDANRFMITPSEVVRPAKAARRAKATKVAKPAKIAPVPVQSTNASMEDAIVSVSVEVINTVERKVGAARPFLNELAIKMGKGNDTGERIFAICEEMSEIADFIEDRLARIRESEYRSGMGSNKVESESDAESAYPVVAGAAVYTACRFELQALQDAVAIVHKGLMEIALQNGAFPEVSDEPYKTAVSLERLEKMIGKAITEIGAIYNTRAMITPAKDAKDAGSAPPVKRKLFAAALENGAGASPSPVTEALGSRRLAMDKRFAAPVSVRQ